MHQLTEKFKLIDLTYIIDNQIPTWDLSCGFKSNIEINYSDSENLDKFKVMSFSMQCGAGTHIDLPNHCFEGKKESVYQR